MGRSRSEDAEVARVASILRLHHRDGVSIPFTPLYDPVRDGVHPMSLTAQLCGDPQPGRRELVERANRQRRLPGLMGPRAV